MNKKDWSEYVKGDTIDMVTVRRDLDVAQEIKTKVTHDKSKPKQFMTMNQAAAIRNPNQGKLPAIKKQSKKQSKK
jgi:hypothetical protein